LLHRGLPRRGVGPRQALELRGPPRPVARGPPRGAARPLPRCARHRARARAVRDRRGGPPPPSGRRRGRPRRTDLPRAPRRAARDGPLARPRHRGEVEGRRGARSPHRAPDRVRGVPRIGWELDMGFSPAEVATGIEQVLALRGLAARVEAAGEQRVYHLDGVTVVIGPLPPERATHALFHPRALLVVEGEGRVAEAVKAAIRLKFLRVTGCPACTGRRIYNASCFGGRTTISEMFTWIGCVTA